MRAFTLSGRRGIALFAAGSAVAAITAGTGLTASAAGPSTPPPSDCAAVLAHATTNNLFLGLTSSSTSGGNTTYVLDVFSNRTEARTVASVEACAYSNGNAAVPTYGATTANPTLTTGHASISLTVTSTDAICVRSSEAGQDTNGPAWTDYTKLLGLSNGAVNAGACSPAANVPEVPATALLALAGLGGAATAVVVRRRRAQHSVVLEG